MNTTLSNLEGTQRGNTDNIRAKIGIKTQQGLSQHTLWLSKEDAKIYSDLLKRNGIWHVEVSPEF